MKTFIITAITALALSLAQGFNGTFQNQQGTGQILLQQAPDGTLQGQFTGTNGAMQIQGTVDSQGAFGTLTSQEAQLAFQAQLSPDGSSLEMLIAPLGTDGQPDVNAIQQLIYQRTNTNQPSAGNPLSPSAENPLSPASNNPLSPPAGEPQEVSQQGFLEPFDSPESEFTAYLLLGPDNGWNGQLANGSYQLSNTGDPGAVRYFYATALGGNSGPLSSYPVSVDISGQFSSADYSQAGLIFNFDPENRFYYALMIKGGNMISLAIRDAEGFREMASSTVDSLLPGQVNRLSILPENGILRLLVNNKEVMSIEDPSLVSGGVGIIAAGNGNFVFDNLNLGF